MRIRLVLHHDRVRHDEERILLRRHLLAERPLAEDVRAEPEELECAEPVEVARVRLADDARQAEVGEVAVEVGDVARARAQVGERDLGRRVEPPRQPRQVRPQLVRVGRPHPAAGRPAHQERPEHLSVLLCAERHALADLVAGEDVAVEAKPVLVAGAVDAPDDLVLAAVVEQRAHVEAVGRRPARDVADLVAVEPDRPLLRDALAVDEELVRAVLPVKAGHLRDEPLAVPADAGLRLVLLRLVPARADREIVPPGVVESGPVPFALRPLAVLGLEAELPRRRVELAEVVALHRLAVALRHTREADDVLAVDDRLCRTRSKEAVGEERE